MSILLRETTISDLLVILAHEVNDERGYLIKYFDKDVFREKGLAVDFYESAEIMSNKGTIRGLHYQKNPSQARLIHVVTGLMFNAALDLRPASATFGKYETTYLASDRAIFIPEGFANGFLAMEDNTVIVCHYTNKFSAEGSGGILWNDTELNIPWPIDKLDSQLIISEKDKMLQLFKQYRENNSLQNKVFQ